MVVSEVVQIIHAFAPIELQASYDNSGLQIGDPQGIVTGILVTVDITEAVLDEAIQKNCNVVVAHHPLIFGTLKSITGKNLVERCVVKAITHQIAIIVGHTNLDSVKEGVSFKMYEKLGLTNCRILVPKNDALLKLVTFIPKSHLSAVQAAVFAAGGGEIGNYAKCSFNLEGNGTFQASEKCHPFVGEINEFHTELEVRFETIFPFYTKRSIIEALTQAHPYEEVAYDIYKLENSWDQVGYGMVGDLPEPMEGVRFLEFLKDAFNLQTVRYTALADRPIRRVAVMGGSGSDALRDAINAKADVFVSGDFKYHQFFDAENRIVIADIGHYESEQFTKELFYEILTKKLPTFAICKSSINTNPIKYL